MTFFYLTNFSYVKTVLTIWSVSQFAIFKNRHVFADPITYVCTKKIVIERTRDLIYLKFIATDFFPKIISLSAGKNSGDLA